MGERDVWSEALYSELGAPKTVEPGDAVRTPDTSPGARGKLSGATHVGYLANGMLELYPNQEPTFDALIGFLVAEIRRKLEQGITDSMFYLGPLLSQEIDKHGLPRVSLPLTTKTLCAIMFGEAQTLRFMRSR